ncbi:hypothetical protein Tco_0174169 [Tanacetum coccineum]
MQLWPAYKLRVGGCCQFTARQGYIILCAGNEKGCPKILSSIEIIGIMIGLDKTQEEKYLTRTSTSMILQQILDEEPNIVGMDPYRHYGRSRATFSRARNQDLVAQRT